MTAFGKLYHQHLAASAFCFLRDERPGNLFYSKKTLLGNRKMNNSTNLEENNTCEDYIYTTCSSKTEQIGYLYIIPSICCLGICFNTLVLLVFHRFSFRTQMTPSLIIYLTGLTIADLFNTLVALPLGFVRCIDAPSPEVQHVFNFYERYLWVALGNITMTSSIWITLIITTERFLFLYSSGGEITGQSMGRSSSSAAWILTIVIILATLLCIPLFFYLGDISVDYPVEISDFARSTGYEVYSWIRMFIVQLIPITSVAALNIALIRIIKVNKKNMRHMVLPFAVFAQRIQSQNKITAMMLSISCVFVFGNLLEPFTKVSIVTSMFGECSTESSEYETFKMFSNMLLMVTYASNFVSYCLFHDVFLLHIKRLFGCKSGKVDHCKKIESVEKVR